VNESPVKLNLWDTAGQERFRAIAPIYYKEARGAVLVYDITDQTSFDRVVKWVKELQNMVGKITMVIAGNKSDREQYR
jgi:Ras-related protein Rab-21